MYVRIVAANDDPTAVIGAYHMIPCSNPSAQYQALKGEIDAAIHDVLNSGRYILGDQVRQFESEFASYLGVRHTIGCGSGTEALHLALRALNIGLGDEVVTVSHTAVATVAAIELAGATPVLVDIEPRYYTVDVERLAQACTSRTRAVIPVHLYGQPADLTPIVDFARGRNIRVIEDCAQAHGAHYAGRRVGTLGDIGCFSFYPTKNLGAIGDGGMVVTQDTGIAERARLLREYGWAERYVSAIPGWNSRLDELQAAVLRIKLRLLDQSNAARQDHARRYDSALAGTSLRLPARRKDISHVFHLYVVRSARRDALQAYLKDCGVSALVHYPVPVHMQPAYEHARVVGGMAETETAAREVLSLPLYPELEPAQQDRVIEAILDFEAGRA